MCYHNTLQTTQAELEVRYNRPMKDRLNTPIYHSGAFPKKNKETSEIDFVKWPVVTLHESEEIQLMNWGFAPPRYTSAQGVYEWLTQYPTYNAKGEELESKKTFAPALKNRQRCIIPSTGFFEYRHEKGLKIPYFISVKGVDIFSMAGIYSHWSDPDTGQSFGTFSIITVTANDMMDYIHNSKGRMPLILQLDDENAWLDYDTPDSIIQQLIKPFPQSAMKAHTVDRKLYDNPMVSSPVAYDGFSVFT